MHQDDEITSRALDLFDRYADMPRERLNSALEALRQQDAAVHASLVSLLDADARRYTFASPLRWIATRGEESQSDGHGQSTPIWRAGTRLGAWCVDNVIGIGGMGVVYAAHRADGLYEQDVALKTIRSELISPALLVAFAHERSNLARLEHVAIASLVDAGIGADGQPWLAMQRVVGEPIDRWCDERGLDLRMRVQRLIDACDAVRYAHEHGILHQDIKPSNLLVTHEGQVKLLDFGLSSLLPKSQEQRSARIGVSSGYAAPEVFRAAPPSIAIDVYALGVMLYRLICGEGPVKLSAVPALDRASPRAPSALAALADPRVAAQRGARRPEALARRLRGDLDAIALRAVAVDPDQRYATVAELQRDLDAWIERQPVSARGDRWYYRARSLVRRNAIPFGACAVCLIAIAFAAGALFEEHRRAQDAAEAASVLGRVFEESLGVATLSSLGNAPLTSYDLLIETEKRLRERVGRDRPKLLARGLTTLARSQLINGDYAQAARLAHEAKAIGGEDPLQCARADAVMAQLLSLRSRHADAERTVRAAIGTLPEHRGIEDDLVRLDLQMQLARARWGEGDTRRAIAVLDAAVSSAQRLGDEGVPALAELLGQRGYAQTQLFRFQAAEKDLRRSMALSGDRNPVTTNTVRRYLANLLILTDRRQEALRQAVDLLESNRRLFGDAHPETGRAWVIVGKAWFYTNDPQRAVSALDRAARIFDRSLGQRHPDFADALVIRGAIAYENGDLPRAIEIARDAVDVLERAYGPNHEATLKRRTDLASLLLHYGQKQSGEKQRALLLEAKGILSDVLRTGEHQGLPMAYVRDEYAETLLYDHQIDAAEQQTRRAIAEMSAMFGPHSDYLMAAWVSMIKVRIAQGRYAAATAICARLLSETPPIEQAPYDHFMLGELMLDIEVARGDAARIRRAYRELEAVARQYHFMDALNAKHIAGFASSVRRG
jgi:eukaryotic-like serine/threonine-protein kinase